jgi:Ca-activated chloride channel homolog
MGRRIAMKWKIDINLYRAVMLASLIVLVALPISPFRGKAQQKNPSQEAKPQSQEVDGQPIRLGAQLVNVLFSAADKQNRYIENLTASEITVIENGKAQEIFTFKKERDLPLKIAIVVDISRSVLPVLPRLMNAGARFINTILRPEKDRAAIIEFEADTTLVQDLTSNPTHLRKGLEDIAFNAPPLIRDRRAYPPPWDPNYRRGGTSIYDSVIAASTDLLAKEAGRKTIILFTDGYDTTSLTDRSDAINEALRSEITLYAIGIGDPEEEGVDRKGLEKLCEPTGGRAFAPKDLEDLDQAFAQLERELREQYLVAYDPTTLVADGKFRKIEIRINNRKDVRVRHRRGYYAPKA